MTEENKSHDSKLANKNTAPTQREILDRARDRLIEGASERAEAIGRLSERGDDQGDPASLEYDRKESLVIKDHVRQHYLKDSDSD